MNTHASGGYAEPRILGVLRAAYTAARELAERLPPTGWKWKRPPRECPDWCAQDHTCTVRPVAGLGADGTGYQLPSYLSEHRSPSGTWHRPWGVMVATRVQRLNEPPRLELRLQVELSGTSGNLALAQGVHVPLVVDQAVTTVLAELEAASRARADIARARHRLTAGRGAYARRRAA